ncbi:MAG: clostripain-related cysteine peptidase [Sedimentisphaerales bacterium]
MRKSIYLFGVLLIFSIVLFAAGILTSEHEKHRWVFVYYMSYDNDLNAHGQKILSELAKGIKSKDIAVVTQADFSDLKGMKRIELYSTNGKSVKRKESSVKSENSTDPNELVNFFDWVRNNWKADNYCIVFLDHGGSLNNMCRDDRPTYNQQENWKVSSEGKWLPSSEVGKIVADFNRSVDGKVRLLFLQQCGRGSIQNLYSFIDTSEYIMASPVIVGAPNTYYAQTLRAVSNDFNLTGDAIAKTIMREDRDYTIYTLLDCNELKNLPEKLAPVLGAFAKGKNLSLPKQCKPLFDNKDEKFYDLNSYFEALGSANEIGEKELQTFFDWCDNKLIVSKQINVNSERPLDESWQSGLSIFVPSEEEQRSRYDFLSLYKNTNLKEILRP